MTIALAQASSVATRTLCRLCGETAEPLFRGTILGQHRVSYFRCPTCDLIQTEAPYWLDEAYASAICATDTGAIRRNQLTSQLTTVIARLLGIRPLSKCLDYGGGHGVFVRMMRDLGFDFRCFDTYAQNLYARGFEGDPALQHDLVTVFEVFEHFADVAVELEAVFAGRPRAVLVSTMLHRGDSAGWWYYSPHTGQHIAFYSARTMAHIADRFGYSAVSSRAYTLFRRNDNNSPEWKSALASRLIRKARGDRNGVVVRAISGLAKYASLTVTDSESS